VALKLKSEDAFAPLLNGIILPLALLSGIFLPMTLAPTWLQHVSDANPLKHIIDGVRAMFRGDLTSSTSLWGIGLTLALVVVGLAAGTRVFKRESA
jgi:ABC-2 type transport system permease protein